MARYFVQTIDCASYISADGLYFCHTNYIIRTHFTSRLYFEWREQIFPIKFPGHCCGRVGFMCCVLRLKVWVGCGE